MLMLAIRFCNLENLNLTKGVNNLEWIQGDSFNSESCKLLEVPKPGDQRKGGTWGKEGKLVFKLHGGWGRVKVIGSRKRTR